MADVGNTTDPGTPGQVRAAYEPPLLRGHGALRDLTSEIILFSVNVSDVNVKENIVAVSWAWPGFGA